MLARSPLFLLLVALACQPPRATAGPQAPKATQARFAAKPELDRAWMRAFVEHFAADAMSGRFTLDPKSIDNAANALTREYDALALAKIDGTYRVPFDFAFGTEVERAHHVWVEASGPARALPVEELVTLSPATETTAVAAVTFVGTRAQARPTTAVRDRIALVVDPAPGTSDHADLRALADRLAKAGARALLVISDRAPAEATEPWPIPVIALRAAAAESIATGAGLDLKKLRAERGTRALAGVRLSIAPRRKDRFAKADNVLAWIAGTDKKNEIVMIGAHYDHIGTAENGQMCRGGGEDTICNGADDNASGTAMVLAVAKALTTAGYKPKRTIVFAHFAGEELGLHGSKALADKLPAAAPFAGAKIVAMVNFDMVGRLGKDGLWVGGVGSANEWMPLLEQIGDHGIPTVYERSITGRSDHASFYQHDIPVLFFFTGLHDDYHKPGDEIADMNFEGMATIGDIALSVVVALGDGAPISYAPPGEDDGLVTRMPGSDPRTIAKPAAAPK